MPHVCEQIWFSSLFSCKLFCLWEILYILVFSWLAEGVTNVKHKAFQMRSNAWSRWSVMHLESFTRLAKNLSDCLKISSALYFPFSLSLEKHRQSCILHTSSSRCFPVYCTNTTKHGLNGLKHPLSQLLLDIQLQRPLLINDLQYIVILQFISACVGYLIVQAHV